MKRILTQVTNVNKKRNPYFDFLKGLAIIGVIAIHTLNPNFDAMTINGFVAIVVRNLLGCCVPLFIALSGYFVWKKEVSTINQYKSFIVNRLSVIYIPMLIWAFPWLVLSLYNDVSLYRACMSIGLYLLGGLSVCYFITLMLEFYILLPLIQNVKLRGVIFLSILTVLITAAITLANHLLNLELPLLVLGSFPLFIGYFAMGCYYGRTKSSTNMWMGILISVVGLILAVLESYYWIDYHQAVKGLGLKPSVSIMSFGIIMVLLSPKLLGQYKPNKINNIITYLGMQSLPIYLSHCLVIVGLLAINITSEYWFLRILIVSLLDAVMILILQRILPKRILPILGIR